MKDWQERAIREGRTPLPDYLGDKPSLATVGNLPAHPEYAQAGTSSSHRSSSATVSTPASVRVSFCYAPCIWLTILSRDSISPTGFGQSLTYVASSKWEMAEWNGTLSRSVFPRISHILIPTWVLTILQVKFPDRTLESIKQTFHKRRHAVEKRMAEERADTTS